MANDPAITLCVDCGHRGFTRTKKQYSSTLTVDALECNNCKSIMYEHEAMTQIQAHNNEQAATSETM